MIVKIFFLTTDFLWEGLFERNFFFGVVVIDVEGLDGNEGQSLATCPLFRHRKHPPSRARRVRSSGVSFPGLIASTSIGTYWELDVELLFREEVLKSEVTPCTQRLFRSSATALAIQFSRVLSMFVSREMAWEYLAGIAEANI